MLCLGHTRSWTSLCESVCVYVEWNSIMWSVVGPCWTCAALILRAGFVQIKLVAVRNPSCTVTNGGAIFWTTTGRKCHLLDHDTALRAALAAAVVLQCDSSAMRGLFAWRRRLLWLQSFV